MRISDWSSDVCSSDLNGGNLGLLQHDFRQPDPIRVLRALPGQMLSAMHFLPTRDGCGKAAYIGIAVQQGQNLVLRVTDQRAEREIGRASCRERVCQYG